MPCRSLFQQLLYGLIYHSWFQAGRLGFRGPSSKPFPPETNSGGQSLAAEPGLGVGVGRGALALAPWVEAEGNS